jgi:hypothetical protein
MGRTRKAEASRENGRRSHGPTSARGKSHVRLNALKTGLFSRETVIPCAGESLADFNELRDAVWEQFNPRDATTAILADQVVNSYFRLLRARRCETGETKKRLETATWRLHLDRIARVNSLKSSFLRHHVAKYAYRTGGQQVDTAVIAASIEEVRVQLKQTAAGLEFLTDKIKAVEEAVRAQGHIPQDHEVMLIDVCGIEDDFAMGCFLLNTIAKTEMEKRQKDKNADTSTFDLNKQMLLMTLSSEIRHLTTMTNMLEQVESAEEDAHLATLVLPAAEGADRIHRAEAAHQRSFYRALDRLLALPKSNAS